jgi:hypothetical protein
MVTPLSTTHKEPSDIKVTLGNVMTEKACWPSPQACLASCTPKAYIASLRTKMKGM